MAQTQIEYVTNYSAELKACVWAWASQGTGQLSLAYLLLTIPQQNITFQFFFQFEKHGQYPNCQPAKKIETW